MLLETQIFLSLRFPSSSSLKFIPYTPSFSYLSSSPLHAHSYDSHRTLSFHRNEEQTAIQKFLYEPQQIVIGKTRGSFK